VPCPSPVPLCPALALSCDPLTFAYPFATSLTHLTLPCCCEGALQQAMLEAESQGVLSSSDDTSGAASSSRGHGQDSKTRKGQDSKTQLKAQSKSRQEPSSQVTEVHRLVLVSVV